jgi:hypothetical protein
VDDLDFANFDDENDIFDLDFGFFWFLVWGILMNPLIK